MAELAGAAFLMGVVGSLHCIGMCGPFALMCGGRAGHLAGWQLGKVATYMTLGAIAGGVGAITPGPAWLAQAVAAVLIVWFAAAALGLVPEPSATLPGLHRIGARVAGARGTGARMAFGVVNGLLPCGLVYAALGLAIASERPGAGAVVMAAFGLGTAPLLTVLGSSTGALGGKHPRVRRGLAVAASLAGLWVVARRGGVPMAH